ncbi:tyrosine-protein kinase receptor [Holotrichia oblita]|uniref:Tyrosine-protein kinase receptor n=1 Tax=Holotrichia oblita TaxID=644536 RepID=A0ACB9SRS2_HOLOL|nr:tyrosine-protein kinase receptor [Holotrichia oblita]
MRRECIAKIFGACPTIPDSEKTLPVYYITCPEVTINFAHFPVTPTGKEVTLIEQATGKCVKNAEVVEPPTYLCKGDGKWTLPTGACKCKAGFEPDFEKQTCNVCPSGKFKSEVGDNLCQPCPEHSKAPSSGFSECTCDNDYYRAPSDPKNMSCTQPPSAPQNLSLNFVDQSTVMLSWTLPDRLVTTYRFQVFAENGVSHLSTKTNPEYADLTVTTEASIVSSITNVRITSVKSSEITLIWEAPVVDGDVENEIETYEVRCFPRGDMDYSNSSSILTKDLTATFTGLMQRTEYGLQVRAKSKRGWGAYSPVIFKTTGQVFKTAYVGDDDGFRLQLVAGGIVAIVVVIAAAIVLTVVFLKSRSNDECNKKQPSDCDTLEYRNGEVHHNLDNPPIVATHTNVTTPLFTGIGGSSRTYIDPHTYEDPNQAVREFAREIDAGCITIEAIIGGGEFGDVCKGKLKMNGIDIDVAIKTLKAGSLEKSRNDFLTEASIMGQFEHPNVIFLQGVVTKSNPVMIITEYMENGSLDTFLRANDGKFQIIQLVGMLRGIAAGMQYLSDMNYVHRDLAARNVLVNSQLVCKIADFGLSREIESATEGAYTTRGGKIPVRWTAPEAIAFRKFTSASDVWSMGIVCWEVMSYGERPYWNWSNQDVIKSIEKGYRLPAPMDCPEAIYQLMLDCWQKERTHRPTFQSIVKTLDKLIRVPDTLRKIAQNRRQPPFNPYFWHTRNHLTDRSDDLHLSDASIFQNPAAHAFTNSLRRDVHPNQRSPNRFEWGFANQANFDSSCGPSEDEVRRRFSSLLNLTRGNQFLNDLDECSEGRDENWARNNFEMERTSPENQLNENDTIYKCINSYSDLIYDNRENLEDPDCSYGFLRGVVGPRIPNGAFNNESDPVNCGDFERNDVNSDRWQMNEGLNLNRWSPPRDTNHRFRSTDTWVTFQNANPKSKSGNYRSTNPLAADAPDLTNFTSVEEWLNSIKMARYLENFHAGGINTMDAVVNLTVKELTELGITLVGHQKKIMNSVQNIRAQIRVNGSEGFLV